MTEAKTKECKQVIVRDCCKCFFHRLSLNWDEISYCIFEDLADTARCTFGLVPRKCPLLDKDIVIKLREGIEVMPESTPEEPIG